LTRRSGWLEAQKRKGRPPGAYIPEGPTEWEKFLKSIKVTEGRAVQLVSGECSRAVLIRSWIRSNARSRYCPEKVLDKMGFTVEV
jgi:hypothetical protein